MEMASTHAKLLIEALLNVHGLANMHRASENDEYRRVAAEWLPKLERGFADLKRELERQP